MVCIYNEILPFATARMDLGTIVLNEMSDRKAQEQYDFTHMWHMKQKVINRLIDSSVKVTRGSGGLKG